MSAARSSGRAAIYVAVAPLYVGFGVCLGLLQVALPTFLQRGGMPIEQVGYLALLFLPLGLSALWAPLVDRFRILGSDRRLGWIVASQSLVIACLAAIAFAGPQNVAVLIPSLVVLAFAAATMDVSLDGHLSETSALDEHAIRGGLKVSSMYLGTITGATLALLLFERLGWFVVLLSGAVLSALALIPFLLLFKPAPGNDVRRKASFRSFLIDRAMLGRTLLVASVGALLGLGLAAPRLFLVDSGLHLEAIGILFGPVSMLAGLAGAVTGVVVGRRWGLGTAMLAAAGLFATGMLAMSAIHGVVLASVNAAALVVACCTFAYGASYGGISAMALSWTEAAQAATDYAIVQSVWNSSIILGGGLSGLALASLGTAMFGLAGIGVLVVLSWLALCLPAAKATPAI